MPKVKTKRNDILRQKEVLGMLEKSKEESWLQCLIALAWVFGKRINELLKVKREDIWVDNRFLYCRFQVSKKRTRKDTPIPRPYLKRITLRHLGVEYILTYVSKVKGGVLFPSIDRHKAYYHLKKLNHESWWHLFRESLATEMAERGATEEMLMHWFDWDRVDTAHAYVKRGTKLTQELSERIW